MVAPLEPRRLLAAGDLDTTFGGGDGKSLYPFTPFTGPSAGYDIAVQADGKFVAVGSTDPGITGKSDFLVARFNADGTPDLGFGYFGLAKIDIDGAADVARGVVIDGSGKIIVAGTARVGALDRVALARLNTNGTLDTTFDVDGKKTFGVTGQHASANDVALAPGGKIVTAGAVGSDILVARFNANGSPDASFGGGDGWTGVGFNAVEQANAVAVLGDGRIVAVGSTTFGTGASDVAVVRLTAGGTLDSTFSGDGKFNGNFATDGADFGNGLAIDSANRILVAGSTKVPSDTYSNVLLLRLTPGGQLDNSFAGDGSAISDSNRVAHGVIVLGSGQIVAAGYSNYASVGDIGHLSFFDTNGTFTGYNDTNGTRINAIVRHGTNSYSYVATQERIAGLSALVAANNVAGSSIASASVPAPTPIRKFAVQPDGKAILAGTDRGGFYLARVNPDGGLDTSFGRGGQISAFLPVTLPEYQMPRIYGFGDVMVLPDGKILALGSLSTIAFELSDGMVLARFNANGSLDTTFGDGGFRIHDVNNDDSFASSLRLTADGKILAAGVYDESSTMIARFTAEGDLDLSFGGGDGMFTGGPGWHELFDVAPDGKIVYGGETTGDEGFYLGRLNANGTPDTTFGGDGQIKHDYYSVKDLGEDVYIAHVADVAVAPDGKIVLIAYYPDGPEVALVRLTEGGALDTTFGGGDGLAGADFAGTAVAQQVDVQADGKILVAGTLTPGTGGNDLFLARFTASGGVADTSFGGGDGIVVTDVATKDEWIIDLQIVNGKAVVFADADVPTPIYAPLARRFAALRYDLAGTTPPSDASAVLSGRTLIVTGTANAETIGLSNPTTAGAVTATVNGSALGTFNTSQFDNVILRSLGGNDTINGSSLPERLEGGAGNDSLLGNGGNDTIEGGAGGDTIKGGTGNDTVDYSARTAPLVVGLGTLSDDGESGEKDNVATDIETVRGGSGNDFINGSAANNLLVGNGGNDTLNGLGGDDTLDGGAGTDSLNGGDGTDTGVNTTGDTLASIENGGGGGGATAAIQSRVLVVNGTAGADVFGVTGGGGGGSVTVNLGASGTTTFDIDDFDSVLVRTFGGNDSVSVNGIDDGDQPWARPITIEGGDGNDTVDLLQSGVTLIGGAGDDTLNLLDESALTLSYDGGAGSDWLVAVPETVFFDLNHFPTVENGSVHTGVLTGNALNNKLVMRGGGGFVYGHGGNDTITVGGDAFSGSQIHGGDGNDSITGGGGNDEIFAGAGDDSIDGGLGNDLIDGDLGADVMKGGGGNDTVTYAARTAALRVGIGTLADDGEAGEEDNVYLDIETVIGGSGSDFLNGSAAGNRLVGNGGNDTLLGNDGNDTLEGGVGSDQLEGNNGNDSLRGGDGNDRLFGGNGDDRLFGDAGDDLLYGQNNADILDGGSGSADRGFDDGQDTLTSIEQVLT